MNFAFTIFSFLLFSNILALLAVVLRIADVAFRLINENGTSSIRDTISKKCTTNSCNQLRAVYRKVEAIHAEANKSMTQKRMEVDVDKTNITLILEHLQVEGQNSLSAPWMYSLGSSPFLESSAPPENVRAFTKLAWNGLGSGNGSCESGGSGKATLGYLDPFNNHLYLDTPINFSSVRVEFGDLFIHNFRHVNTLRTGGKWDILGEAGDARRYKGGSLRISSGEKILIQAVNLQWMQNTTYPSPIGAGPDGSSPISGYFVAELEEYASNEEWIAKIDPFSVGYILGIFVAASYGPPTCITANTYWITLRGFPDIDDIQILKPYVPSIYNDSKRSGAKSGYYNGSNEVTIERVKTMGKISRMTVASVVGTTAAFATCSTVAALLAPITVIAPPGVGVYRMVTNTAFVASMSEVYGFHSDSLNQFGDSLKPFIGKLDFPFTAEQLEQTRIGRWLMKTFQLKTLSLLSTSSDRQENEEEDEDEDTTISDSVFSGCAFYTSLALFSFFGLHVLVWLFTRNRSMDRKIAAHAWMIYIFSIVMSFVFTAAVLNAGQYIRSHIGKGTGRTGLFVIAFLQLIFIGIGFTVFFLVIMYLAVRRVRRKKVKWVPREYLASPFQRRKAVITGEYQADDNMFHKLFECYYSSLAGPRVWFAGFELMVMFLDALCTATIWNEVLCLGILVCIHATVIMLFLVYAPHVDRIEGRMITVVGFADFMIIVLEFLGSLGTFQTADIMETGVVVLGFISIIIGVLLSVYCDLVPTLEIVYRLCRNRYRRWILKIGRDGSHSTFWTISRSGSIHESSEEEEELLLWGEGELTQDMLNSDEELGLHADSGSSMPMGDRRYTDTFMAMAGGTRRVAHTEMEIARIEEALSPVSVIVNSADSDDKIEWPRVGQVIYSVRDPPAAGARTENEEFEEADDEVDDSNIEEECRARRIRL